MSESQKKHDQDLEDFVESNQDVLELLERVWQQGTTPDDPSKFLTKSLIDTPPIGKEQNTFDELLVQQVDDDNTPLRNKDLPESIGRFKIRRLLGQGGFGLVFLAYDPRLKRQVALKIPRPESVMTDELKSRFIREAETAASLNHANIVPIFESGSSGLICYIAAGFCDGPSLAEWVQQQNVPVQPEIAAGIIINLADAIQHAHSRGVVHRDIKPQNILVDIAPQNQTDNVNPTDIQHHFLITDFGLAKSIDESAELTRTGSVLGTPSYMAPEQISCQGESSPTSDIYSLGAILYFLLSGRPPIVGSTLLETIKLVEEQPPTPLCKLRPDVPRDLEAICLKCLEKEVSRRYQTASEFQADLLRFQKGHPVLARRTSKLDRAMMWCRRRPMVAGLAATLFVVLAISSIALGILLANSNALKTRADAQAVRATEERDRARNALDSMTSGVAANWLSGQRELSPEQTTFLEQTIVYYREFAAAKTNSDEDQFWAASAGRQLSRLLSRLGHFEEAHQSIDQAIEILQHIPADREPVRVAMELANCLHQKETLFSETGDIVKALPLAEQAAEIYRNVLADDPDNAEARRMLANTTGNLGSRLNGLKRLEESLVVQLETVNLKEQLVLESPDDLKAKRGLGISYMNLGNLLTQLDKHDDAQEMLTKSLLIRRELVEAHPESARLQSDLAFTLNNLGGLESQRNNWGTAEPLIDEAIRLRKRLVNEFPLDESFVRQLATSLSDISVACNKLRKFEKSKNALTEAIAVVERGQRDFPSVSFYPLYLARNYSNLAIVLAEQGLHQEAIEYHDAAVTQLRQAANSERNAQRAKSMLHSALLNRATALGYVDRHEDAISDWDAAIESAPPTEVNTLRLCRATSVVKQGNIEAALKDVEQILAATMNLEPARRDFNVFYNSACVHSLVSTRVDDESESRQHAQRAIELLKQSIEYGFQPIEHLKTDPELAPLRDYPEFRSLLNEN